MTKEPTVRDLQRQLADLTARIPEHLLLKAPLTSKAPPEITAMVAAAKMQGPAFQITWPKGFSPYELCGLRYGKASDARACWDFSILGSFYGDKSTFQVWVLRFFSPSEPMQILGCQASIQHAKEGVGEGARYIAGFGDGGSWFLGVEGFTPAFGDENMASTLSLQQRLAAQDEQLSSLRKRIEALEAEG